MYVHRGVCYTHTHSLRHVPHINVLIYPWLYVWEWAHRLCCWGGHWCSVSGTTGHPHPISELLSLKTSSTPVCSFLIIHTLGDNRYWLKSLGLCQLCGRYQLSSLFLTLAQLTPHPWENLSSKPKHRSLLCFCLSALPMQKVLKKGILLSDFVTILNV